MRTRHLIMMGLSGVALILALVVGVLGWPGDGPDVPSPRETFGPPPPQVRILPHIEGETHCYEIANPDPADKRLAYQCDVVTSVPQ